VLGEFGVDVGGVGSVLGTFVAAAMLLRRNGAHLEGVLASVQEWLGNFVDVYSHRRELALSRIFNYVVDYAYGGVHLRIAKAQILAVLTACWLNCQPTDSRSTRLVCLRHNQWREQKTDQGIASEEREGVKDEEN